MNNRISLATSVIRELGLWAGVIVSFLLGALWCLPLLIQWAIGNPHTGDTLENFLILCMAGAGVCLLAMILFIVGAMRNTVGGGDKSIEVIEYGDSERM